MVTTYFVNLVMGNVFGSKKDIPLPGTYYIGLSMTEPNQDGTGVSEPVGGNYSRVAVTSLSEPVDGMITNSAEVEFNDSTEDWGTMNYYVVYDASTNGNLLIYNALEKPRIVQSENQVRFKPEAITFTLEGAV